MMNVCQIVDQLKGGGQERVAVELANALRANGQSAVLCTRRTGDYQESINPGVGLCVLERTHILDWRKWIEAVRFIRLSRIGILHAHTPGSWFYAILLRLINPTTKAVVLHVQMWPPRGTAWRLAAKACAALVAPLADHVIVTNQDLRRWFECRTGRQHVSVVFNPTHFPEHPFPRKERRGIRVAMVAQWRRQKDQMTAVRAVALARARGLEVSLDLIGAEEDTTHVQSVCREIERLGLLGVVQVCGRRSDVRELLRIADVGLLCTHFEGLPVAVIEYCAAALPVVVTAVEGTYEILNEAEGIFGVPSGDADAVARRLEQLSDFGVRRYYGDRAYWHMKGRADTPRVATLIRGIYARAFGSSASII